MVATKASQDIGRLEGKVDSIAEGVEAINKKLLGNGQRGLLDRMTIVEGCVTDNKENAESTDKKLAQLLDAVNRLTDSVDAHHKDKQLHSLWGMINMKVAGAAFLFVVAIIATVPADISLWELIKKWFGY